MQIAFLGMKDYWSVAKYSTTLAGSVEKVHRLLDTLQIERASLGQGLEFERHIRAAGVLHMEPGIVALPILLREGWQWPQRSVPYACG